MTDAVLLLPLQGLIKVRGDKCWLDLTCMDFHYEVSTDLAVAEASARCSQRSLHLPFLCGKGRSPGDLWSISLLLGQWLWLSGSLFRPGLPLGQGPGPLLGDAAVAVCLLQVHDEATPHLLLCLYSQTVLC